MKPLFTLALFIISFIGCSAQTIIPDTLRGFWNIPFGTSYEKTLSIIKQKGFTPNKGGVAHKSIVLTNTKFGNTIANFMLLNFYQNKLGAAIVQYNVKSPFILDRYNAIRKGIIAKYGWEGDEETPCKYPYTFGDGYEESSISMGYCTVDTKWTFAKNSIDLSIESDESHSVKIFLSYYETDLMILGQVETEIKKSSDY